MVEFISKYWPSILILIAGILGAFATFVSSKQDSEQKDNIEKFAKENLLLSKNIDTLQKISVLIEENTNQLTKETKLRVDENIEITKQAKVLVDKIQSLTTLINERAAIEVKENQLSGIFEFEFDVPINSIEDIRVGGLNAEWGDYRWPVQYIQGSRYSGENIEGPPYIIECKVEEKKFILNVNLIDPKTGEFLLRSQNNNWIANSRFKKLINYDKKGFEIVDEKNDVVFNFNITDGNLITFQFILHKEDGSGIAYGPGGGEPFYSSKDYNMTYRIAVGRVQKYFYHEGLNWFGKRL